MPDERLAIGDVAAAVGMSVHALRFYERQGLLIGPVERTPGGRRRYTRADVEWLRICTRLRESGMPLADLQRFAALVRQGPGNEAERLALLDAHRERVEQQIHALEDARRIIAWKTGVYRGHLENGTAAGIWDPSGITASPAAGQRRPAERSV